MTTHLQNLHSGNHEIDIAAAPSCLSGSFIIIIIIIIFILPQDITRIRSRPGELICYSKDVVGRNANAIPGGSFNAFYAYPAMASHFPASHIYSISFPHIATSWFIVSLFPTFSWWEIESLSIRTKQAHFFTRCVTW